jgi:formylglycine-generating enzyme required for sulfatase activity
MRLPCALIVSCVAMSVASPGVALVMDWVTVGNPGNPGDPQTSCYECGPGTTFGSVDYVYSIGIYEVTNAQYAEFLNAKAASDPLGLYSPNMGDPSISFTGHGGITQSGSDGSYTYSVIAGRENMPVVWVSFYDALRFANWMNNGQGNASTESGSYTLLGGTIIPSNGPTVTRNAGATIVLTSEDEWYKAAYYDPTLSIYYDYPAGSNTQTTCSTPPGASNSANCDGAVFDVTPVGSYTGSASSYGTFDQGGNVGEWNESIIGSSFDRGARDGTFYTVPTDLAAARRFAEPPHGEGSALGLRLVMLPEPSTGLLVIAGLLGLGVRRRVSPSQEREEVAHVAAPQCASSVRT